jgi:hypothetical protein
MDCDFPLCWACEKIGYWLAEHAQKSVTHWLSMSENWLFVGWACAKIGCWLADPYAKIISFHSPHAFSEFFLCSPFNLVLCPFVPSLSNVICPLSHVSVPCLPSYDPYLTSLLLVFLPLSSVSRLFVLCLPAPVPISRLCSLFPVLSPSQVSVPCLPASVPCLAWSVPWLPSFFFRPQSSINCPSVLFL